MPKTLELKPPPSSKIESRIVVLLVCGRCPQDQGGSQDQGKSGSGEVGIKESGSGEVRIRESGSRSQDQGVRIRESS